MANSRKRAPGGGRRSKGPITGKTSTFTTRITPATRDALDAEAKVRGQSVSQVAEKLLELGIGAVRDHKRSNPTQALLYAFGMLAAECELTLPKNPGERFTWSNDGFLFDALRAAIGLLFDHIPRPKVKTEWVGENSDYLLEKLAPSEFGKLAFLRVWGEIANVSPPSSPSADNGELTSSELEHWKRTGYDMQRLRRDLSIEGRKK